MSKVDLEVQIELVSGVSSCLKMSNNLRPKPWTMVPHYYVGSAPHSRPMIGGNPNIKYI